MAMPAITLEVAQPKIEDIPVYKEWVGTLTGKVNATIMPQVSGYLKEQVYQNGSFVKKGDVLFRIDDRTFKAVLDQAVSQLAQAESALEKNKLDVERYTPLVKTNAVSQKQLDDAILATKESEAAVAACKATIEQARLNLEFTVITSPIDGIAAIAKAQIGDLVSPAGTILTSVASVDPIRLDFAITEQDWLGTSKEIIAKHGADKAFEASPPMDIILSNGEIYDHKGRATAVDLSINPQTGSINIIGEIDNPARILRPGMFVRVKAKVREVKGALTVPSRAVIAQQGAYYLALLDKEGTPSVIPVKPGDIFETDQVITPVFEGSLTPDSQVVVIGTTTAMMEMAKPEQQRMKFQQKPYVHQVTQPVYGQSQAPGSAPKPGSPQAQSKEQSPTDAKSTPSTSTEKASEASAPSSEKPADK